MSNVTITKMEQILPLCRIKPVVLEVEINPTFQQPKLFDYCKAHGILPIAYSPLGSPCRPERDTAPGDLVTFEMPELLEIAKAHNCHPAVICVKWAVQRGQVPIPFSVFENEYVGNLKCTTEDFLTDEEMETIENYLFFSSCFYTSAAKPDGPSLYDWRLRCCFGSGDFDDSELELIHRINEEKKQNNKKR